MGACVSAEVDSVFDGPEKVVSMCSQEGNAEQTNFGVEVNIFTFLFRDDDDSG